MATSKKNEATPATAQDGAGKSPSKDSQSAARQKGRRLKLFFANEGVPILHRIEFQFSKDFKPDFRQQGHNTTSFQWRKVAKAISLMFLEYAIWNKRGRKGEFWFEGPDRQVHAKAISGAIYKPEKNLLKIFAEPLGKLYSHYHAQTIFLGPSRSGKFDDNRELRMRIDPDFLPPDCVEIFWNIKGDLPLTRLASLTALARNFRKVLGVPEPPAEPIGEGSFEEVSAPVETSADERKIPPDKPKGKPPETATELFGRQPAPAPEDPRPKPAEQLPKTDIQAGGFEFEFKPPEAQPTPEPEPVETSEPPAAKIDPRLFEIHNPDELEWHDSDPLINFGSSDSDEDVWKIRDASEGVLIFGAVGSGKTSGSGSTIATQLLTAGYGGLVLTAKTDEAKRWLRLCERTGRKEDCIHITPRSGHKLNVLQYETERPGERLSVADDLVALLRCVNAVASRSRSNEEADRFWTLAPNKLMKNLFELFWISGEPFTINNFVRFINRAPKEPDRPWKGIEYFSKIITKAEANAKNGSLEDKRMFAEAFEYWTKSFPAMPDVTRGGVVASFDSMAEIMNGRGIYEMLCTETNLTPEMILSGKIVILDFPVKESSQGGLMVQATWKLLFEQAIERRADKGASTARPVFLWEDEGHEFFSQHDVRFQPTARDCRACHVIMSQNLHNFYHLGHGRDGVEAVFAAMNTHIFHTNGDHDTNSWASQKIGNAKQKRWGSSGLVKGFTDEDYKILFRQRPGESKSAGGVNIAESNEPGMPPEDFSKLKRGGDGICEAVILWLGHQFAVNKNRNYHKAKFRQEQRPSQKP